ncbi:hypothetical protein BGZ61DRAFT_98875 [Ilyonectria robusta]|uniref:uncharacterized protein n=1 Tax=Ilyonectria robusta TaxID=1079257 RepID=UPI001E8D9A25|nr:uncharacterized protein BGZ61DRAFT_98875 [Ilyonectria robusta]KAH8675019.1 hypothetical protein BGZ61DRAFT_98875 [Ilyonectria robusta]
MMASRGPSWWICRPCRALDARSPGNRSHPTENPRNAKRATARLPGAHRHPFPRLGGMEEPGPRGLSSIFLSPCDLCASIRAKALTFRAPPNAMQTPGSVLPAESETDGLETREKSLLDWTESLFPCKFGAEIHASLGGSSSLAWSGEPLFGFFTGSLPRLGDQQADRWEESGHSRGPCGSLVLSA